MKILITASTYPRYKNDTIPGFVHDFAAHLAEQPEISEVHALVPHAESIKTLEVMDGVTIHRFRYWFTPKGETISYGGAVQKVSKSPLYLVKLASLLLCQLLATYRLSKRYKIDVINAHWLIPMGFSACLVKLVSKIPVLITIHGGDVFSLRSSMMSKLKRWSLKRADAVVVNSSATEAEAKKLFAAKTYPIIPMGVDVGALKPLKKVPREESEPLRLLFVGRLSEEKGVQYLIEAVSILSKSHKRIQLTIAGTGPYEETLKAQVYQLKLQESITFAGWTNHSDFPTLFANHDLFVGPSVISDSGWQEAFGLVFAESLALETPVIGTTTGGIEDIVTDGKNGLLVPQRDSTALAVAIERCIDSNELLSRLADDVRQDINSRFSWQACLSGYLPIFQSLASSKKKNRAAD